MTYLSKIRSLLFVVMLVSVFAPSAVQAGFVDDECPEADCRNCEESTNTTCWLPFQDECWEYVNCASYNPSTCTIGEGGYKQCYCGPCIET